ncbi:MAG: iron ABC transporter permease [Deltaproteobacteria bacterium]|nr:iron ABC transporter permease [Deltaproteobacteria bacterium]
MTRRALAILLVAFAALPAAAVVALSVGSSGAGLGGLFSEGADREVILSARLPRVTAAAIVGAALSVAGAALQAILNNPLAEPFVLGVSGGAALGGTFAILAGLSLTGGAPWIVVFAFAGASLTTLVLSLANRVRGRTPVVTILLTGVVFNAFAAAIITFAKFLVPVQRTQQLIFWLSGMIGYEEWRTLAVVGAVTLAGIGALAALAHRMNVLSLGDEVAGTLGANPSGTRTAVFLWASLLTGAAVAISGLIGFVGLVVPQALRLAGSPDNRFLIPASAAAGAAFVMLSDALCRFLIGPVGSEPPLGAVTALIGGPVFIVLLRRYLKNVE